ncbi:hypothetical protein B0O99DRAFT_539610 [Bisporella sp. PMI_857]|nr:hypothetical protein B0O99DRAFT_539610 [Bisporella sp. PMI_857]
MLAPFHSPRLLIIAVGISLFLITITHFHRPNFSSAPILVSSPSTSNDAVFTATPSLLPPASNPAPLQAEQQTQPEPDWPVDRFAVGPAAASVKKHWIEELWENAKASQAAVFERQSKTLEDAKREYKRRYQILPPPGYDEWYAYARKHNSKLIDEFDDLMENIRPFRGYQEHCQFELSRDSGPALMPICIINKTVDIGHPNRYDTKQIANPFKDFVSDFVESLPDMCFHVNTFDEPRQIIPAKKLADMLGSNTEHKCERYEFRDFRRQDVWPEVIVPCAEDSPARDGSASLLNSTNSLVETWNKATDLCSFNEGPPVGYIRCPNTLSITNAARPVLSNAKLSTFSDILFPTLWRWRFSKTSPEAEDKTPWEQKKGRVGWRGTTTGGFAWSDNWRQFQRHRMVGLANGVSAPPPYQVESTKKLQSYLDVRLTAVNNCEPEACDAIKNTLPVDPNPQPLTETFQNKIVLDMDGYGLSGRFYILMRSGSAVMKQGLMREWHDSRLVPWLHYIPLSMGAAELEGILEYLLGPGDEVLRSIAEEGRAWTEQALRREDTRIYMYRLLIELGRRTYS